MRFFNVILLLVVIPICTPAEVRRTPLQPPPVEEKLREICERGGGRIETENPQVDLIVSCDAEQGCYRFLYKGVAEGEAQEIIWYPRFNVDVTITARVECYLEKHEQLRYLYGVKNATSSKQPVHRFVLEYLPSSSKVWPPDEGWRGDATNGDHENRVVWWYCYKEPHFGVNPGAIENGFAIDTSTLPTLTMCWAAGYKEEQILADDEPPFEVQILANTGFFEDSVHGYTIGPATGTKPASWEGMREFLKESRNQHWITEESAKRIADLIAEAEDAESGEDRQAYRTALQRLLDTVTALYTPEEKEMTSEAYALFFFHTEARLETFERDGTPETE